MDATTYSDGTYLTNNPGWHADDSAWKQLAARMLGGYSPMMVGE